MKFDGKDSWMGFKHKFIRFAEVNNWTLNEMRDNLCWSLEGKASDFYASTIQRHDGIGFNDLLEKLEKRFGGLIMPDTAQDQLSTSSQKVGETIEDWADRVMQLALRAYPDLPEHFMQRQAMKRICHGCSDKDAGQYVANLNLESVELVIDKIKSYKFNHQTIFDRASKRDVREILASRDAESGSDTELDTPHVRQSRKQASSGTTEANVNKRIDGIDDKIERMQSDIQSILRTLESLKSGSRTSYDRSRSPSPNNGRCFSCNGFGHMARDCPKRKADNRAAAPSAKHVSFSEDLNAEGSA